MNDMAAWLETVGLGRYAALLADHDVDFEVLPTLTEQDLEKLGLSLGHRKKFLQAIAALADGKTGTSAPVDVPNAQYESASLETERQRFTRRFPLRFSEVLMRSIALLYYKKRISYLALRQEFDLDDAALEALRFELIRVEQIAVDQDGECLLWAGTTQAATPIPTPRAIVPLKPLPPWQESSPTAAAEPVADASAKVLPLPVKAPTSDAERRQITVMFCDLVGSTALSTQLDPEDLQDVIRGFQDTCTRVIQDYGGYVAKYMGDGILVYFGYPQAHEEDAERALHTSLAIVEAMRTLNTDHSLTQGVELAVRIGLATGVVVVGDLIGEGASEERNVVGETPNLAARLQGLAKPNEIVIGSVTKDLAGDGFLYQDLGAHELKGISGNVKAWAVVSEREFDETDIAAQDTRPLVGRHEELGLLQRAWAQSQASQGQVVLMSGEAGIGRTRLVDALSAEVKAAGFVRITLRCSPYHTNSALYPVIEHFKRVLGWQHEDDEATKLGKLEQALSGYQFANDETIPLFAALLSLSLPERYPALQMTPQQQRQRTLDEIVAWLFEETERQPVLQVWEDVNWADPTTLELLALEFEQCPTVALMTAITYRPEFSAPWPMRSHITPLTLSRLDRREVEQLIQHHAGGKALPADVVEHIAAKADGVPMYVEELTKMVIESDFLRECDDRYELTGPLSEISIPSTLQDSLTARLDRLPSGREVAQLGAVLGREFAYSMIRALSTLEEPELNEGLNQLVDAELLYQRGRPPRATYIFKQALIQDAAYQLLLKRTRQQYHQQVAELLEAQFPDTLQVHPELVAHHYTEAGNAEQAIGHWQQAGQLALQHSANLEAIAHLTKGLELLETLHDTPERLQQALDIQVALSAALMSTKGYGAPEVEQSYTRAQQLCQQLGDTSQLFPVLRGLLLYRLVRGEIEQALRLGEQLLTLAESQQDPTLLMLAHYMLGMVLYHRGEQTACHAHLSEVLAIYTPQAHKHLAFLYGIDLGVGTLDYAAWNLWMRGYPEQAIKQIEQAFVVNREIAHPFSETHTLIFAAVLHQFRREPEAALARSEAAVALAKEQGFTLWEDWARVVFGSALTVAGQDEEGIKQMHKGLDTAFDIRLLWRHYFFALLAQWHVESGDTEAALSALKEGLRVMDETGDCFWGAELHRLHGKILLKHDAGNTQQAETCFQQALELARSQQAKSLELRAATSLARLWQQQNKSREAHDVLEPIYNGFTEGFDTADLKQAKALLGELSRSAPTA